jgi:hypothetical protein
LLVGRLREADWSDFEFEFFVGTSDIVGGNIQDWELFWDLRFHLNGGVSPLPVLQAAFVMDDFVSEFS